MKDLQKAVLAVMLGKKEEQVDEAKKPLHPNQQKLDVHEPEKDELTSDDFKMLRAGKKAKMKEEQVEQVAPMVAAASRAITTMAAKKAGGAIFNKMSAPKTQKEEVESVEEGFDDLMKAAKERQQPQPSGGAGMKKGSRYGGSKQKEEKPMKEETEYTFGDYLQAAKAKFGEDEAVQIANDAFNKKDTSIFSSSPDA